ncbi:hypothetical protein EG328_010614 [Venturia inaequalis]|uniref:Uncharacterized protein n=2 Tax=Venturia inaequalis TaxID=5025 RepID=A0A8H3YKT5_VENIN|nr:hypothetical protein EG328_010614 [Venturia inaequalis]
MAKACNHDATKNIVDTMNGQFAFSTHFWKARDKYPRFVGDNYIYATGINGDDNKIGQAEMTGLCKKKNAGRYCWTPGSDSLYNYKGEWIGPGKPPAKPPAPV